jgi:hypothetical protein
MLSISVSSFFLLFFASFFAFLISFLASFFFDFFLLGHCSLLCPVDAFLNRAFYKAMTLDDQFCCQLRSCYLTTAGQRPRPAQSTA